MVRDEDDSLDGLLDTAVEQAFRATGERLLRNDPAAKSFLDAYEQFYQSTHQPSNDLCTLAGKEICRTLNEDPHSLYPATTRWSTLFSAGLALATPALYITLGPVPAACSLAVSGVCYLLRRTFKERSAQNATAIKDRVTANPSTLIPYLHESRQYMGHELFLCGRLNEDPQRKRKHRKKKHKAAPAQSLKERKSSSEA